MSPYYNINDLHLPYLVERK